MYYCTVAALILGAAGPLAAQTLTLHDALRRADQGAYANRIARGTARAEAARADAALRGILPTGRVEAGWMRTTNPVGAFGITLQQRSVTAAAFNPATLNYPAPTGDVAGGLVLELPLINADAWLGRRAAASGGSAAAASARWTGASTQVEVVRAYYGALLAAGKVTTLEAAVRAARDHVRAAEALFANGLATRSDALLASVQAGQLDADLAGARADVTLARAGLALLLGEPDSAFALPASLPDAERVRAISTLPPEPGADARADLDAARWGLEAARADRRRAGATLLPRLNAFARYDWHAASAVFGGKPMWTTGLMASWSPFTGGAELADARAAAARLDAARAAAEAAGAQARLDVVRRDADVSVAQQRLTIAETGLAQSTEAHRLVARRYESGLAPVVELLDAAAIETRARLNEAAARYDLIVATAARLQANGQSLLPLDSLDR